MNAVLECMPGKTVQSAFEVYSFPPASPESSAVAMFLRTKLSTGFLARVEILSHRRMPVPRVPQVPGRDWHVEGLQRLPGVFLRIYLHMR